MSSPLKNLSTREQIAILKLLVSQFESGQILTYTAADSELRENAYTWLETLERQWEYEND